MKDQRSKVKDQDFKDIKLLILDVDGVLTDGRIIYDSQGNEYKIFNVHDGYGIELLKKMGVKVAIASGKSSSIIERRARDFGIEDVYQGIEDKADILKELLIKYRLNPKEVCAVGDDLLDIGLMKKVGLPVAVDNAMPEVKRIAKYVTKRKGGEGAVREIADLIQKIKLKTKNKNAKIKI